MADYDSPWKDIIERYFEAFLRFFFPQAHAGIDWSQPYEFLDKELAKVVRDAKLGRRRVDKLVRVRQRTGEFGLVLIHLEVQSRREQRFNERMYIYNYRLFDRYQLPVASLAVLVDTAPRWRPDRYGYELFGCQVEFRFTVVKLLDLAADWAGLEANANPFAVVVMAQVKATATAKDAQARYVWKSTLVKGLYARNYSRQDVLELFRFIDWVMELPSDLEARLTAELLQFEESTKMRYVTSVERLGIKKGYQQGRQEGHQQGRQQGLQTGIALGLELKFGAAGLALLPEIQQLEDSELLENLLQGLRTVSSPEDLRRLYLPSVSKRQ